MLYHKIYKRSADAEWVLFVHGAGGSSAIWFKQLRAFRELFNVLVLDLRGHGRSSSLSGREKTISGRHDVYTLQSVCQDIIDVMDHQNIRQVHFVGVSFGTILTRALLDSNPERVMSLVMAGAITYWTPWARVLISLGNVLKYVVPFRVLYASFAWIIMPGSRAREARTVFRREAKKIQPAEFRNWLTLTAEIKSMLPVWRRSAGSAPTFYVMGERDYIFLPHTSELADNFPNVELAVLEYCGHVCNVEQPDEFNRVVTEFLLEHGRSRPDSQGLAATDRATEGA